MESSQRRRIVNRMNERIKTKNMQKIYKLNEFNLKTQRPSIMNNTSGEIQSGQLDLMMTQKEPNFIESSFVSTPRQIMESRQFGSFQVIEAHEVQNPTHDRN